MIESERHGEVELLRMVHGKANIMDLEFCEAVTAAMVGASRSDARAVVLTGQGGIFSAGADLNRVITEGESYVARFLPALDAAIESIYALAKPVVAAINGHAIAGGCILAAAADRRLMARGSGRIGMPELRVGVPFPPVALELARSVVQSHALQRALAGGETFEVDAAQAAGLIDAPVEAEQLLEQATALAADLAGIAAPTYALTKAMLQQPLHARIAAQTAAHGAQVDALWQDAATFDAVRAFVSKTMAKG